MAERLKTQILEERKAVDLVCGPDAYKDLPRLLSITHSGQTAVNVMLSLEETYADVMPIRLNENSPSAFVCVKLLVAFPCTIPGMANSKYAYCFATNSISPTKNQKNIDQA